MLKHVYIKYKLRHRFLPERPEFRMTHKTEKLTKAAPLRKKNARIGLPHVSPIVLPFIQYDLIADCNSVLTMFHL